MGGYLTLGGEHGNPLQYSCLENPMDRGACWAAVYGVTQSRTRLKRLSSNSSSILPWEVDMATHSNILAWRIPWTEEPDRVQFMGLQRVGHDCSDLAHMHTCELVHICELVILHSILLFCKKMHSKDSFV